MIYQRSKSGLFLIELIIAIVFFSVASAICVGLFVQSHLISTRSADISSASLLAQNYAEWYKAMDPEQREARFFGQGEDTFNEEIFYGLDDTGALVVLDQDRNQQAVYLLTVLHEKTYAPTLSARVHVFKYSGEAPTDGDEALFSLDVKSYGAA